jgi:hypothetical protein
MELDPNAAGVLNVLLYRRCVAVFGRVRIANPGEAQIRRTLSTGAVNIVHPGEYYAVCCPLCSDTRFRCYINHAYGTLDSRGFPQTSLVHCFNDGCSLATAEPSAFEKMRAYLLGNKLHDLSHSPLKAGKVVDPFAKCRAFPGECTSIAELPDTHPGVLYLRARDFDARELAAWYDVRWCCVPHITETWERMVHERLVIPLYHENRLVGWQARPPFDLSPEEWKQSRFPKYYTAPGTPKRAVLYGLDVAKRFRCGVIVEGVTDVWRFGGPAVAVLGASLNEQQLMLFANSFASGAGVIMLDTDILNNPATLEKKRAKDKAIAAVARLNNHLAGGCCLVSPPVGWDPGSMPRNTLLTYVREQAAAAGVQVDWNLKDGPSNIS